MENLESEIGDVEKKFADFVAKDVAATNKLLAAAKLDPLKVATKEEWKSKDQAGGGSSVALEDEQVEELQAMFPWLKTLASDLLNAF
jgi:hypothetical protein